MDLSEIRKRAEQKVYVDMTKGGIINECLHFGIDVDVSKRHLMEVKLVEAYVMEWLRKQEQFWQHYEEQGDYDLTANTGDVIALDKKSFVEWIEDLCSDIPCSLSEDMFICNAIGSIHVLGQSEQWIRQNNLSEEAIEKIKAGCKTYYRSHCGGTTPKQHDHINK